METNKFWGYLHVNGSIQAKRYLTGNQLEDAKESPFVKRLFYPFTAKDRDSAISIIKGIVYK